MAGWSARHRWLVFGLWFVLTIGTFALSRAMGGISTQGATGGGSGFAATEASQGLAVLDTANQSREPGEQFVAVISLPDGSTSDQLAAVAKDAVAKLQATAVNGTPVFTPGTVIDPTTVSPQAGLLSPDGTSVQVPGRIPDDSAPQLDAIRATLDALRAAHPEAEIHSVSFSMINDDINAVVFSDLDRSLLLTIPITFVILLIAFGAFAASVVPLILALTSLLAAFGLLGIYSNLFTPGQPVRDTAGGAHRPRGGDRLLALHGHALPQRAAARPRHADRHRDRLEHGRAGSVLQRPRGDDLGRRSVRAARRAVPLDGTRHDRGDPRVGDRQPDVPARGARDPGTPHRLRPRPVLRS